jgi:enterochelin esterase-like enzyme
VNLIQTSLHRRIRNSYPALAVASAFLLGGCILTPGASRYSTVSVVPSAHTAPATDSIDFVPLGGNSSQRDCSAVAAPLCRVRSRVDARALGAALDRGTDIIQDGDELTFLYRGTAKSVSLTGGLQYPMSPVIGTDLWVVTLHVANANRAVVSYSFYTNELAPGARIVAKNWRGAEAGPAAVKSTVVAGRIRVDTLPSRFLSAPRAVISYVPAPRGNDPIVGVVYMGDGGSVHGIAPYVDTLIAAGRLPRVMLVGAPNGMPEATDPPGTDVRAMEYLWGFEENNRRFLAHERFVIEEMIPFAEATLGAPSDRAKRAVWGISNSGGWAITMGLRHPDVIGSVLAFSPGGSHGTLPPGARIDPSVRFLLQGGTLEPTFRRIASDWADTLKVRGLTPAFREIIAGHDWLAWCEQFPAAIRWAWVRDEDHAVRF